MISKKKAIAKIGLHIPARQATPAPPVGPALGEHRLNIMDFCKKFNEATKEEEAGVIIPVVIFVYMDRSFDFILKQPPASELIKKAAGIKSGSATSKVTKAGTISIEQVRKIAIRKLPDLNTYKLEAAMEIIKGTAKNMGVEVIKE